MEHLNTQDHFCIVNDMKLTVVSEGYAEAEMPLCQNKLNSLGVAQGGAVYTLADFAFAGAANANREGRKCLGSSSSIHYLQPGTGSRLKAVARMIHTGKKICLCNVEVFDDHGKMIATATFQGVLLKKTAQ